MNVKFIPRVLGAAALTLGLASMPAHAATMTLTLNTVFNGTSPTSTSPWLTAVFTDITGGVQLTLTSSLNVSSEFFSDVTFNVDSAFVPSGIGMSQDASNPLAVSMLHTTQDAQNLIGGGSLGKDFDFGIAWATSTGVGRFDGTDVKVFTLLATGLTAANFNTTNASGIKMGAHVQGIPSPAGTTSGAIKNGVPVPDGGMTLALLGGTLMGLGALRRRLRR